MHIAMNSGARQSRIRRGTLINVTHGEYSDYYVSDTLRVLKGFAPLVEYARFAKVKRDAVSSDAELREVLYDMGFVDYLVKQGFVERLRVRYLNLLRADGTVAEFNGSCCRIELDDEGQGDD